MPEFEEQRKRVHGARAEAAKARARAVVDRERVERLVEQEKQLHRSFDRDNKAHAAKARRLETAIAEANKKLEASRDEADRLDVTAAGLLTAFEPFLDPRKSISKWCDGVPILMIPVRLETRFKLDRPQPQLWVRVYPDDCSIDTFEELLSETEITNARRYWAATWAAACSEAGRRAAWRGLAGDHGSGRAEWILLNYVPVNQTEAPKPVQPTDVFLIIPTETLPAAGDRTLLEKYWPAVWRAGDDAANATAAFTQLVADVGNDKDRATALVAAYVPTNLALTPPTPTTRDEVNVHAVFLQFPKTVDLDVRRHSWTRAATAELMPDRFVFIGYRGGKEEVIKLSAAVRTPLFVAPNPSAPKEKQIREENGELIVPPEMQWMTDFEQALAAGMAFRIDLTPTQASGGFDRVLVVGLRFSSDEVAARQELETLLTHHRFSRAGLSIVPQGTPTNNTDDENAGYSAHENPDQSFDDFGKDKFFDEKETAWNAKRDGLWLAEYLGIDPSVLARVRNSGGRDQLDARAMNTALWPATLGYWMESMLDPVFTEEAIERTRAFFIRSVLGRGPIPALRIGKQPYGILPATPFSRSEWMAMSSKRDLQLGYLHALYAVLRIMDEDWRMLAQNVSYTGKGGDPHQLLLDIVGLHASSVEFAQRYAESAQQLHNRLNLEGLGSWLSAPVIAMLLMRGKDHLRRFGANPDPTPEMLKKFFLSSHNELTGPVIDDRALSEKDAIRPYTTDNKNYLQWLASAAQKSLETLYEQKGFVDDTPPQALLYLMLRHALQLGYHDTALRLYQNAGLMTAEAVRIARRDDTFIHVRREAIPNETRYRVLYATEHAITGEQNKRVGDFIGEHLQTVGPGRRLLEQVQAVETLQDASTARLERAFAEHIDTCAYRLDAWLMGVVNEQLVRMRNIQDGTTAENTKVRQGIYLGAYAWLEDLRPEKRQLTDYAIPDPDVAADFVEPNAPPLKRDSANLGYIHAPSLNHGVAAAILRNGYVSNATKANAGTLAVNLSSERVRSALGILEGIRNGQSLGALLGYQLERGLHDRYTFGVELDQFIYKLRREFPLVSNRQASTRRDEDDLAIESIEARNVVDGLALVNHIVDSGKTIYPFGKTRLPAATDAQRDNITAEAARLIETYDAVADLAIAEGVFQAVIGNYDRVASTLDAYSKGNFPPEPLIVRTPFEGAGITHRVALHLEPGVAPTWSPSDGLASTPRTLAEPALNRWLATVLPPLNDVACVVAYTKAADNTPDAREVTLFELDVQPADVLALLREDRNEQSLTELEERITRVAAPVARPDRPIEINYMKKDKAPFSIFEVTPLVRHLRKLLRSARPLQPTDLMLSNEAKRVEDGRVFVDVTRITEARLLLNTLCTDLGQFVADLKPLLDDLGANRVDILNGIDTFADRIVALLGRASSFAIPQSGWGFVYDFRSRVFGSVSKKAAELITKWTARLNEYDLLLQQYDALIGETDEQKFKLLMRAETSVSTTTVKPFPPTPGAYRAELDAKRALFQAKRDQFAALRDSARTIVTDLFADAAARLPVDAFEFPATTIVQEQEAAIRFAQDVLAVAKVVEREALRRRKEADDLLAQYGTTAMPAAKTALLTRAAKVLLGDDFVIVPELELDAARRDELAAAFVASASLLDYQTNTLKSPQPVDTWLYGVARVREPMRDWEQIVMLTGALNRSEPELTPLQLPHLANDHWLALEFPEPPPEQTVETDRLLYTAHFSTPFDANARQCGLLLDEWTELIPDKETTTGITFHYDRPNNEAPQVMLLLTPSVFQGSWQWQDVVDSLHEALDLAKRRAVEPAHLESMPYAQFLPATVMAATMKQLTISMTLALNNDLSRWMVKT